MANKEAAVAELTDLFRNSNAALLTEYRGLTVAQLKQQYDLVILDCPPLLAVAETREIAGLSDGVILAAKWRSTPDEAIVTAARLLPIRLNHYIGIALTRVDLRKQSRFAPDDSTSYYTQYQQYVAAAA